MSTEPENQVEETEVQPEVPKKYFKLDRPVFVPHESEEAKKSAKNWIGMFGHHSGSNKIDQSAWKPMQEEDRPHMTDWAYAVDDAAYCSANDNYPYKEINLDPTAWRQSIMHNGSNYSISPRDGSIRNVTGSVNVTGKKFMTAVRRKHKGRGVEVMFPLPHTGIWVAVKPAKDIRWIAFDTERAERRISIGRQTNGLMLSARAGYEHQDIFDFITEHVTQCNVLNYDEDTIFNTMSFLDLPILIWGFCVANRVGGNPVRIPCIVDPGRCQNYTDVILQLQSLAWYNTDKLNKEQLDHISDYRKDHTLEEVEAYRKGGIFSDATVLTMDDGTRVTLRVPTINEALFCSRRWCENVIQHMDDSLKRSGRGDRVNDQKRFAYLLRGLEETHLREYAAWISKIETPVDLDSKHGLGQSNSVWTESVNDFESWLEEMADDEDVSKKLYEGIKDFMSKVTLAVIGHPVMACKVCDDGVDIASPDFATKGIDTIVPLDMTKYFLVTMARHVEQTKQAIPLNPTGL